MKRHLPFSIAAFLLLTVYIWAGDPRLRPQIAVPEIAADSAPVATLTPAQKQQLQSRRDSKRASLVDKLGFAPAGGLDSSGTPADTNRSKEADKRKRR